MRNLHLDYLRGLAVVMVLGRHLDYDPKLHALPEGVGRLLHFWQKAGWAGVDLFFVLSGFLVSGLLFTEYRKTGTARPARFLLRRGFKIYPAFYFLLLFTALWYLARGLSLPGSEFASELFYVQNFGTPLWQHTWSLAVEEHFYLLLALAAGLLLHVPQLPRGKIVVWACLAGMTAALMLRIAAWESGVRHYQYYMQTQCRIDALLCGVFISYFYHLRADVFENALRWKTHLLAVGLACCLLTLCFDFTTPFMLTFGLSAVYLGFAAILVVLLLQSRHQAGTPAVGASAALAPLAFIGVYSYSIYLWHIPVRRFAAPLYLKLVGSPIPFRLEVLLYLTGSIVLGFVMARLIELPFLNLREKYFPSAARATTEFTAPVSQPVLEPAGSLVS